MRKDIEEIVKFLENENIEQLNFNIADNSNHPYSRMILGSVKHDIHMKFSSEALLRFLKHKLKLKEVRSENLSTEDEVWAIIDTGDLVIHLVNSFVREKYGLDALLNNNINKESSNTENPS